MRLAKVVYTAQRISLGSPSITRLWTLMLLWNLVTVSSCPNNINTDVFTVTGASATVQYNINSLPLDNRYQTYKLIDPFGTERATFLLQSGQNPIPVTLINGKYTWDSATLSFTIDNIQTGDAGVYKMVKTTDPSTALLCNTLYVKDKPIVTTSMTPLDVTECTDPVTLTCIVSSKPVSTITWYRDDQQLPSTGDNNVKVYNISDVDRNVTGLYRCKANNGYGGDIQDTVNVTVKYRPDVSVTTPNATTQDSSVDIVCSPSGVPDQYTFSQWTHQWDINGPELNHPGLGNSPVLKLTKLKYSHSGVYTCHASNGVDCSKNQNAGSGHVTLLIKAAPVIIDPQTSFLHERVQVASKINSAAIVNITFWSNAGNVAIRCHRIKDNRWLNSPEVEIVQTQTTVRLPVFSSYISTTGTLASVSLMVRNKEDFGNYDIFLSNEIDGDRRLEIIMVAQGPPETPILEAVQVLSSSSVSVNWTRGFHGGLGQTIVTQISTDNINWQNKTSMFDGKNESLVIATASVRGLSPLTVYFIRMFAYNDEGMSDHFTEVLNFTTHAGSTISTPVGAIAGGIVGAAAVIIFVVVVVVCLLKQRNMTEGKKLSETELTQRTNIYESTNAPDNSDHDYTHLQRPASARLPSVGDGRNIYEIHHTRTDQEHIYSGLSRTENVYVNMQIP